jgi:limonene-1,2-epoxide hydrolase
MTQDLTAVVKDHAQRWGKGWDEIVASYQELLGTSVKYLCQPDIPVVTGFDAAMELMNGFHSGFGVEAIEVEWTEIVQVGNTVWNERTDWMVNASGERFLAIPIAGYFRFDDEGTLTEWHDYWSMTGLNATLAEPAAAQ